MAPAPGRSVPHRPTEDDTRRTTHRRVQSGPSRNHDRESDRHPRTVTQTLPANPAGTVDLRVPADGQEPLPWTASRHRCSEPGTRSRPERV
ncbi:hypothetical protein RKD26_006016 [Streptomyces calvus]|uniref:hypothetical protein n=1 Tax=Streptomyces calvus TaxID=67282 RepID=UPI003514558E